MKKMLIIQGHPDSGSYCQALFEEFRDGVNKDRWEIETLELGKLDFDPVLRFGYRQRMEPDPVIERSQELLKWADHVVLVFPVWWAQVPSLLKGWMERVLTPGFAYNFNGKTYKLERHLAGRTATLIMTSQAPTWLPTVGGTRALARLVKNALGECGIKVTRSLRQGFLTSAWDSDERRQRFVAKVSAAAKAI
jgi:putative NADPH-quinone reductase